MLPQGFGSCRRSVGKTHAFRRRVRALVAARLPPCSEHDSRLDSLGEPPCSKEPRTRGGRIDADAEISADAEPTVARQDCEQSLDVTFSCFSAATSPTTSSRMARRLGEVITGSISLESTLNILRTVPVKTPHSSKLISGRQATTCGSHLLRRAVPPARLPNLITGRTAMHDAAFCGNLETWSSCCTKRMETSTTTTMCRGPTLA